MSAHAPSFPDLQAPPPLAAAPARRGPPYVQGFVAFLILCQLLLLSPDVGVLRLFVRAAAFGGSLFLLFFLRGGRDRHPATPFAIGVIVVMLIGLAHPGTTNLTAGAAQAGMYVAVLGPLFWASRLKMDVKTLSQALFILWAFHTASAGLGVLQVMMPGQFQPALSTVVTSKGRGYLESLMITTATGARTFRPMGLYDVPGAAAVSAMYAILLGTGFLLTRRGALMTAVSAGSMALGMTCMYLSQVRSALVMTAIALIALAVILALRAEGGRLFRLLAVSGGVIVIGYAAAQMLAGAAVTRRIGTLVASRPGQVYYANRGAFLEDVFTELMPRYPFGAGLGRWGMMAAYFGRPEDATRGVWVEIQWAGWMVDGGIPLTVLYLGAILAALAAGWKVSRLARAAGNPELAFWAAVVLAYSVGLFALTFSYPVFIGQPGMEFWLLNAVLVGAARSLPLKEARAEAAAEIGPEARGWPDDREWPEDRGWPEDPGRLEAPGRSEARGRPEAPG